MSSRIILTYEDYAALPNDGKRYELHEGELSVTPAPGLPHQEIVINPTVILGAHVKTTGRGKILVAPGDCDARLEGAVPRALPPFSDLALDPAAIWP